MSTKYWLMKTEPDVFSIDDLKKVNSEPWNGVRNYQARNFMRDEMKIGDLVLFYHSNCEVPGVVGIATVSKEGYPDSSAFDKNSKYFDPKSTKDNPRWILVDVKFKSKFKRTVSLQEIKEDEKLSEMKLVQKGNRLSIMPVTEFEYQHILKMAEA